MPQVEEESGNGVCRSDQQLIPAFTDKKNSGTLHLFMLMTSFHPPLTWENEREERQIPQTVGRAIRRTVLMKSGNQKALALVPLKLRRVNRAQMGGDLKKNAKLLSLSRINHLLMRHCA